MVKKKLKIIWDDEAKYSFRSIYNYIKKRESVETAKKVRDKIAASAKSIAGASMSASLVRACSSDIYQSIENVILRLLAPQVGSK